MVLVLIEIVAIVAALVLVFFWIGDPHGNYEPWIVGCGVLAAGVELYRRFHNRTLAWAQERIWRFLSRHADAHRRLEESGFTNFFASRADYVRYRGDLIDYLSLAKTSVRVAGYWFAHGTEMAGLADAIADLVRPPKNLQITIAVIDPNACYLDELARYLDMEPDEVRSRVQMSLKRLWAARGLLSKPEQERFALKVYDTIPIASVIMVDPEEPDGRLQIDLKPYKVPRSQSFAFELSGPNGDLYVRCRNSWMRLLDESPKFDPAVHLPALDSNSR